jgi:hypothetical protein
VQELIQALAEVYAGNRTVQGASDFLDLANGVRVWAGLPTLT